MNNDTTQANHDSRVIPIFIDDMKFELVKGQQTGAELRALANVGTDHDLWQEIPGHKDDALIRPEDVLEVKPGTHFYTAPSTINPGRI